MKSSLTKNEDALNPILYHTINRTFNLSSSLQITTSWFQVNCNSQDRCKKTIEKFFSQTIYTKWMYFSNFRLSQKSNVQLQRLWLTDNYWMLLLFINTRKKKQILNLTLSQRIRRIFKNKTTPIKEKNALCDRFDVASSREATTAACVIFCVKYLYTMI